MLDFDVVVIGAGHAGCEAAHAAARLGCRVALVTLSMDRVAHMPCNPAIGGTAKGHLVREIDALGGLMGIAADATGLQFRMLNRSRGPAVWSPRAQSDKQAYSDWMRRRLEAEPGIVPLIGEAQRLLFEGTRVRGVRVSTAGDVSCRAVVVTSGTFLDGVIHVGQERTAAGRVGEAATHDLSASLKDLGVSWGRLKTGTPPRLLRSSIAFEVLREERGDVNPIPFSFMTDALSVDQVVCHACHTTPHLHDLVGRHIAASPLYNGQIQGIGPRYCPSLEDKVMRFPHRERHLVVVEPEGRHSDVMYLNGCSMSLPAEVQLEIVRALPGMQRAEMVRPGYAVEYDFVQPTELRRTLELKAAGGVFLAGQINGTSGYEEAAGQGMLAGVNAARTALGQDGVVIERHQGYLGVMVDDLTTQGCLEPYRLFTSRAEHRLKLRADNADLRLTPLGRTLGLVDASRWERFSRRQDRVAAARAWASCRVRPGAAAVRTADRSRPGETPGDPSFPLEDERDRLTVEADIRYEGYLKREARIVSETARLEATPLPPAFDYHAVSGLSAEVRQRLSSIRPDTLGQAGRVPGVTPAAVALLARLLTRRQLSSQTPSPPRGGGEAR